MVKAEAGNPSILTQPKLLFAMAADIFSHAGTCSTVCLRRCVVLQNPVLHLLLNAVHEELHDALLNRGEASGAAHKGTLLVDVLGKNETVCP